MLMDDDRRVNTKLRRKSSILEMGLVEIYNKHFRGR